MQTPTPRISLKKMNSDGSDMVDLDNQYNATFDILDESFIPKNVNSGPRPNSASGIFLYEDNSVSSLYSVGTDEWNCFGSHSPLYEVEPDLTTIPSNTDTYWPIGDSGQNSQCIAQQSSDTVRLKLPGIYMLTAMTRYTATTTSGMFLIAMNFYDSTGAFIKTTQESDIKGGEDLPMNLMLQTLHRVPSGFQDVKVLTYQNTATTRPITDVEVDGSVYTRFQVVYLRPLVQGV